MVEVFTVDSMHIVYQNVVRRFLSFCHNGAAAHLNSKLMKQTKFKEIGKWYSTLSLPREFTRRVTRDFSHLDKWKATEYRSFLLYGGEECFRMASVHKDLVRAMIVLSYGIRMISDPRNINEVIRLYFHVERM